MVRHESVAPQDNAQEIQVWCARDIPSASSPCGMDNQQDGTDTNANLRQHIKNDNLEPLARMPQGE